MPRLADNVRERAIGMMHAGLSQPRIARMLLCNQSTIARLNQRFMATGSVRDRSRSGRPKVTTPQQDAHVQATHSADRFRTSTTTARQVVGLHGRNVHPVTVRRRLYQIGCHARRPKKGTILSARHRHQRLQWCRVHARFTRRQWGKVLFSDESKTNVDRVDDRVRVWCTCGVRVGRDILVSVYMNMIDGEVVVYTYGAG